MATIDFGALTPAGGFATPLGYSGDFAIGPPILLETGSSGLAISVDDSLTPAEQVTVRIPMAVSVSDADTATEFVRIARNPLLIDVNDEAGETEAVTVRIPMRITVSDTDSATEDVIVVPVTVAGLSTSVVDTVTPAEAVAVTVNPLTVNVNDSAAASEVVTVRIPMQIALSDSDSATEHAAVRIGTAVAVSDAISTDEAVTVRVPMRATASDTAAATEALTLFLNPILISVSDTDSATEFVNAAPPIIINIADRDIVEDKDIASIRFPMQIVITEDDVSADEVNVTLGRQIVVFDQRHGFEVVSLVQSLRITVDDTDTASEFVNVTSVAPRAVSVSDSITQTESVQVSFGAVVNVNDVWPATESVRILVGRQHPNVFDSRVTFESVQLLMSRMAINVSDSDPPVDVVRLPIQIADPPPVPTIGGAVSGAYAPTWLFDARQLTGTGMEPLELLLASRDIEQLDPPYRGRLIEEPTVNRQLMDTFWGFTEVSEITVKIGNHDRRLVLLYRADARDQPVVLRRFDTRTLELTDEIYAKITDVALETGAIRISASSPQLSIFEREMPAPLVTAEQFPRAVDLGVVIPVVFGNVTKMPLPYVERDATNVAFDYLVGHGALTVNAVYSVRADGGYTLISANEYVVATQAYPNLTVVRFPSRRVDADGRNVPIVADVSGASRNVIRNIESILSNTVWGLKQTINQASFDAAAAQIDALGLLCDGAMLEQRQAQDVLRELMLVRGIRLEFTSIGEWAVTVDTLRTTIALALRDGPGDGAHTILAAGERKRPETADVVSTYTLEYKEDFVRGGSLFRQQRAVNPFGRDRTISNAFIRDHQTADMVIDYLAKRERFGAELVDLTIPQEGRNLREGDLVEVTYAPMALSAAVMETRQVNKRLQSVSLSVAGWDPEIYIYTPGTLPFDPEGFTGTVIIPPVGGLTVTFTDCNFVVTWQPVSEVIVGGDEDNLVPIAVKDYQVEVYADGVLRRTEYVTTTTYTYTIDKNKIDNPPSGDRDITFVVRARTFDGQLGDPNNGSGTSTPPTLASVAINVSDDATNTYIIDGTEVPLREYVALSRGFLEVSDTDTPTESVALTLAARQISVNSQIDGSNGNVRTGHDFVTIEFGGLKQVSVFEDEIDPTTMEFVQLDFGPGRIIRVYDDAQAEADFIEDGIQSNIRSSVVAINVNDRPGNFGAGLSEFARAGRSPGSTLSVSDTPTKTESVTIRRNPLLINVSDTRTATESVTIRRNPLLINVSDTRTITESRTVVRS